MKNYFLLFCLAFCTITVRGQDAQSSNTRVVLGAAGPELIHAGITYRIVNWSTVGINVGAGPSLGGAWTAISLEHRFYFGVSDAGSGRKSWFFRQGSTFFPKARDDQRFTLNLTVGKDLYFRKKTSGLTIDAGVFHLPGSERSSILLVPSLNMLPALRLQFFFPT